MYVAEIFFLASLFCLFYVFLGYPLGLECLYRWAARPVRRQPRECDVPIGLVIAVSNGAKELPEKIRSIEALDYPPELLHVVVAINGSQDDSAGIARRWASNRPGVEVVEIPQRSKCAAINAALALVREEFVVFTDVRQTLEPAGLRALLENFADPEVACVSGSLEIRRGVHSGERLTGFYWEYELHLRRRLSALDSIFGATGAYYAMRRALTVSLPEDALLDDMYLPMPAFFQGYRLVVEERALAFDTPTPPDREFQRKVRTLAGNYQILWAFPGLLVPGWLWPGKGNRLWAHFVSYKFGRLLLPVFCAVCAVTAFLLPSGWREGAVLGQCIFYTLAVLGWLWPQGPGQRITGLAFGLAAMLMAACLAPFWLLRRPESRWKNEMPS